MPFVQRVVSPIYISRSTKSASPTKRSQKNSRPAITNGVVSDRDDVDGASCSISVNVSVPISDNELETVTNVTLCNALRQLASLVSIANEIFVELNKELKFVGERSNGIKTRLGILQRRVEDFDPKLVAVPESDLESFVLIKNHFKSKHDVATSLFTPETRSETLQKLYDAAAKTPVPAICEIDRMVGGGGNTNGSDDRRASDLFLCTPILGQTRKRMKSNINVEIETRLPAAVDDLRRCTSSEAIGDITVGPDCAARIGFNVTTSFNNTTIVNSISSTLNNPLPSTSTDATDNITYISNSRSNETTNLDDMPLDHRLPSPEEQSQIIASKFPAVVVKVDTSGRRFDRMSAARKSMLHVQVNVSSPEHNDIEEDNTIKRRSRSRKPRGKRRNTIAGTDQKEIEEAANGDMETPTHSPTSDIDDITLVPRSKSSDVLKKDSITLSSDGSTTKSIQRSHFNTLKQWGKNRLKFMNRSGGSDDKSKDKISDIDQFNVYEINGTNGTSNNNSGKSKKVLEKERKLSHERKPSYSSSEKSMTIAPQTMPASINPVKLRESSSIRRQRRHGLGYKDEPHSSSGNWSASSESGRTSIGSEITAQPKSSASSNSLNHTHILSSGPPSSIISRRRFLNTSASSSITSEGTVTPEIQHTHDFYDDETSSAYSCDTEGYYTSFHVDSGLKTLKEEEPVTPMHSTSALSSNNSFGSTSAQTVLSAENEYELFGRGSTSTTASSAGTVCTTLNASGSDRNLVGSGPAVPERKSSLSKLNRSNSTASSCSLERSYSSSTVGSTLERTGTIKRNGVLLQKEVSALIHQDKQVQSRTESPDSGNNTSSSPVESNTNSSPTQGVRSYSEQEYSESSDVEGSDRIERIRVKTTINTSRIPSMCVITPSNSDDESTQKSLPLNPQPPESLIVTQQPRPILQNEIKKDVYHFRKATLLPLNNMLGRLKTVLPHLNKKSPNKDVSTEDNECEPIYDAAGEYVTITDVRNNNGNGNKQKVHSSGVYYSNDVVKRNLATVLSGNLDEETEYVSLNELPCNIRCDSNHSIISMAGATTDTDGKGIDKEKKCDGNNDDDGTKMKSGENENEFGGKGDENRRSGGARVTLDAHGKVVYSSDSLKRRKGAHTTFAPGPCIKENTPKLGVKSDNLLKSDHHKPDSPLLSGGLSARKLFPIRPVVNQQTHKPIDCGSFITSSTTNSTISTTTTTTSSLTSPSPLTTSANQVDKIVIRAQQSGNNSKQEIMRMTPVATVIAQNQSNNSNSQQQPMMPNTFNNLAAMNNLKGAYVNIQDSSPVSVHQISTGNGRILNTVTESNNDYKDYQPLFHDEMDSPIKYGSYFPSTSALPRSTQQHYEELPIASNVSPVSPFQRNNNIYWTLQHKKQSPIAATSSLNRSIYEPMSTSRDDILINRGILQSNIAIEDLYSTPHKNRRPDLKTTPLGFSTFFSPVAVAPITAENVSPIDPRNSGSFKTSTPSKLEERVNSPSRLISEELRNKLRIHETGHRSTGNSPISSGRSTPRLEPQARSRNSWAPEKEKMETCADRLGPNKTTLNDFKRLLLAQAGKATINTVQKKPSAVELLKLARASAAQTPTSPPPTATVSQAPSQQKLNSSMNILDLSGSPKTFANRRMNRQMLNYNPNSPSKSSKSSKSNWRYNNIRSDVMSTSIPEVNSEEDSPNQSTEQSPANTLSPIKESTVIEEKINIRDNIFLKTEENNFMRHEITQKPIPVSVVTGSGVGVGGYSTSGISRSQYLQAQREQFLMGGNNNIVKPTTYNTLPAKSSQYVGISQSNLISSGATTTMTTVSGSSTLEKPRTSSPSLETAL